MKLLVACLFVTLVFAAKTPSDLEEVKAEPNLERRARAALDFAADSLERAKKAYSANAMADVKTELDHVTQAVQLTQDSLRETHAKGRNSKHYKNAEIKTRRLLKRLDAFSQEMDYADRPVVAPVKQTVQRIHDELLLAVMGAKKK
jgi:lipid II:glycine glycyltransferase (peptidoglycan interpeptide bridge formation enzyme)